MVSAFSICEGSKVNHARPYELQREGKRERE